MFCPQYPGELCAFHLCTPTGRCAVRHWGKPSCRSISQYPRGSSEHGRHAGSLFPGKQCPAPRLTHSREEPPLSSHNSTTDGSSLPSQRGCEHPGSLPGNIPACPQLLQGSLHLWGSALAQSTPAALATPPLLLRCPQRAHSSLPAVGVAAPKSSGRTGTASPS